MVRRGKYAPVSGLDRSRPPRSRAFDKFNGKFPDPLINSGRICFSICVAGRTTRPRSRLQRLGDFRERCVGVVRRGCRRWKIEATRRFGYELGDGDRVQVKVVKQPAFVLNSTNREFKPFCYKSPEDFQRSGRYEVRLRPDWKPAQDLVRRVPFAGLSWRSVRRCTGYRGVHGSV